MRVFFLLIGAIIVLGWLAFEQRHRNRQVSQVLAAFAVLFSVLLVGAYFGMY